MNNRKYITDPAILLEQGKAIMSSSDESRYLFRVFSVNCSATKYHSLRRKISDELK